MEWKSLFGGGKPNNNNYYKKLKRDILGRTLFLIQYVFFFHL